MVKIGYSIDDSECEAVTSALVEQLVIDHGFEPRLDVPLCLEYFDGMQVENSRSNLCEHIYHSVVYDTRSTDGNDSIDVAIVSISDVILTACKIYELDSSKLIGVDIIINSTMPRIIIWFNQEDT